MCLLLLVYPILAEIWPRVKGKGGNELDGSPQKVKLGVPRLFCGGVRAPRPTQQLPIEFRRARCPHRAAPPYTVRRGGVLPRPPFIGCIPVYRVGGAEPLPYTRAQESATFAARATARVAPTCHSEPVRAAKQVPLGCTLAWESAASFTETCPRISPTQQKADDCRHPLSHLVTSPRYKYYREE